MTSDMSEDLVTPSMLETILSDFKDEIEQKNKRVYAEIKDRIEIEITPIKESQDSFFENWAEQLKAFRRARSDMQLYFTELKKRDTLREEYLAICESTDMLIDIHKVNMQFESKEKWTKKELEVNQIKYNIIDMIKQRLQEVRSKVGQSLIGDYHDQTLNLQRYEVHESMI